MNPFRVPSIIFSVCFGAFAAPLFGAAPSVAGYSSIQEALDKNPGCVVEVPAGDYVISDSIKIHSDRSGLCGTGRIIQSNPQAPILEVQQAKGVQVRDLTLTRAEGAMEATSFGVKAKDCTDLVLQNLQILDNRSQSAAIEVDGGRDARIVNCTIRNYMRVGVDDRTKSDDWGFAFNCIDGTGINLRDCNGALLQGNSVIEDRLLPTPEIKAQYHLGQFCKKNAKKGMITSQKVWDEEYNNGWTQGAAITLATPETNDYIRLIGNYVENAAQGFDIHADHVIMAQNIVDNAFMGMKAMHGARNVIIIGNQFSRNCLWSIGLMPGAASRLAGVVAHKNEKPENCPANVDGGSIIANNIISDFGYGTAYWMWKDSGGRSPMKFDSGQKDINPPLTDVIIQGNVVYDTGKAGILENGKAVVEPPRYNYAVIIDTGARGPQGLHFSNNLFHPGTEGVANVELKP